MRLSTHHQQIVNAVVKKALDDHAAAREPETVDYVLPSLSIHIAQQANRPDIVEQYREDDRRRLLRAEQARLAVNHVVEGEEVEGYEPPPTAAAHFAR